MRHSLILWPATTSISSKKKYAKKISSKEALQKIPSNHQKKSFFGGLLEYNFFKKIKNPILNLRLLKFNIFWKWTPIFWERKRNVTYFKWPFQSMIFFLNEPFESFFKVLSLFNSQGNYPPWIKGGRDHRKLKHDREHQGNSQKITTNRKKKSLLKTPLKKTSTFLKNRTASVLSLSTSQGFVRRGITNLFL